MKRFLTLALILGLSILLGKAAFALDTDNPIKFGVIGPLTGDIAMMGEDAMNGALIFAKHINDAGGLLGRAVEIVMEDEGTTEQTVINTFIKQLTRGDLTGLFNCTQTNKTLIAEPTIRRYEVPVICSSSSYAVSELENPYLYMTRLNDIYTGKTIVDAAVNIIGMKKPALIYGTDSYGIGVSDSIKKNLMALGIEPVIELTYTVGDKQFAPQLTQIANSGCDGIIAPGQQTETALIMLQSAALGMQDLPKIGATGASSKSTLDVAKESSNGWYTVCDFTVQGTEPLTVKFVDDYRAAYNRDPDNFATFTYDGLCCLAEAVRLANSSDPLEVNKFITKIKDVQGINTKYTGNGAWSMGHTLIVAQIKDRNVVQIGQASRF